MASTIKVSNISTQTTDKELKDFFGFFGQIDSIDVKPAEGSYKSATVTFVKESAAKTALLLDNTALGPSTLKVESATGSTDQTSKAVTSGSSTSQALTGEGEHHISQDDKPAAARVAELLSHGYLIGDSAIAKALDLDQKHGISSRFTSTLNSYNEKYQATNKARGMDSKFGVSDKAMGGLAALSHYFEAALDTPTGQKIRSYYTSSQKQVLDVHNEARRLADIRKQQQPQQTGAASSATAASGEQAAFSSGHAEKMNLHDVGDGKTACNCGGEGGICACEKGKCACGKGCSKDVNTAHMSSSGPNPIS